MLHHPFKIPKLKATISMCWICSNSRFIAPVKFHGIPHDWASLAIATGNLEGSPSGHSRERWDECLAALLGMSGWKMMLLPHYATHIWLTGLHGFSYELMTCSFGLWIFMKDAGKIIWIVFLSDSILLLLTSPNQSHYFQMQRNWCSLFTIFWVD